VEKHQVFETENNSSMSSFFAKSLLKNRLAFWLDYDCFKIDFFLLNRLEFRLQTD